MKPFLYFAFLFTASFFLTPTQTQAQAYWGYQTIGKHNWYVAMTWQGGKPYLGLGYNRRLPGGTPFNDLYAEWRFPIDQMYRFQAQQWIVGWYRPLRARRWYATIGLHAKLTRRMSGSQHQRLVSLGASLLPTYYYWNNLSDRPQATIALRSQYEAVLLAQKWQEGQTEKNHLRFPAHRVELGGHTDLHLERTLGISLDGYFHRTFSKQTDLFPTAGQWQPGMNLFMGSIYDLRR